MSTSASARQENFANLNKAADAIARAHDLCRKAVTRGQLTAGECAQLTLLVRQANCHATELHNQIVIGLPAKPLAP